ncbi:MAG: lipid-A-disaccharide synthase [Rikenellaceae bacterium]|nr:lipid-A-disaccharide synthase [Rikenellaceae bacterium]MCL2691834.1 lipid-A-disaccharide synthase [Rikenellaceae bacterium]
MKYYIIAGEASGDLHGANLMRGILKNDPQAEFRFWGGDRMAAVGGEQNLAQHYKNLSFFGFVGVVKHLPDILGQLRECKADIMSYSPDVLVLIDYPGFNLRMAKFAHGKGVKVFYYIAPKVWAWKESRVRQLRKYVDRLFIIFPFEVDYFAERGVAAEYKGNPLVDEIKARKAKRPSREKFLAQNGLADDRPLVALLAGSRRSEIRYNLPFMAELAHRFPEYKFVIAGVPWLDRAEYDAIVGSSDVGFVCDRTYELLAYSEAAVITSGTATLEAALIGTPEMVCYRTDHVSMNIGRIILKIRFISLVNLIMDREVVRELIQWDMTMPKAVAELRAILPGGERREKMLEDFAKLRRLVGPAGASERIAARMVEILNELKPKLT